MGEIRYHDHDPVLPLFLEGQKYYTAHSVPTKVKSCAFTTVDEALAQAGVDAMTLPGETLEELHATVITPESTKETLEARSVFHNANLAGHVKEVEVEHVALNEGAPVKQAEPVRKRTYIDDEKGFVRDFATNGRGKGKTED
ncbi:MAG: hypothetical protein Q9224_007060, partial [Gallowayella concinna]